MTQVTCPKCHRRTDHSGRCHHCGWSQRASREPDPNSWRRWEGEQYLKAVREQDRGRGR